MKQHAWQSAQRQRGNRSPCQLHLHAKLRHPPMSVRATGYSPAGPWVAVQLLLQEDDAQQHVHVMGKRAWCIRCDHAVDNP